MFWTFRNSKRALLLICTMTFLLVTLSIPSGAFGLSSHESRPTLGLKAGTVDAAAEQDFLSRTNSLRASLGLGSLRANNELLAKARNWAQTMASSERFFTPHLPMASHKIGIALVRTSGWDLTLRPYKMLLFTHPVTMRTLQIQDSPMSVLVLFVKAM